MLEELHVKDLALIEDVWLEFRGGMTALTGETGAGKTALVGALKLLVGERADATMVRQGAAEALVEGRFRLGEEEIVARRRVSADGRSKCMLDGELATVGALAERLGPLVDLHGQHEHQALLKPATHRHYLDRYAGAPALEALASYRDALGRFRRAKRDLELCEVALAEAARKEDYLRFVVNEIASASVSEGEDEQIEARLPALSHAGAIAAATSDAHALLAADAGAADALAAAADVLGKLGGLDPVLDGLIERLSALGVEAGDVATELREFGESVDHDPGAIEALHQRAALLSGLKKKYGPTLADVIRTREESEEALLALGEGEGALARARDAVARAEEDLRARASLLDRVRREAAPRFTAALGEAVSDLAMEHARFEVAFEDLPLDQWSEEGPHTLEFLFAPAPAQSARPLSKIASGGELSRVMLALKGVLGDADDVPVLVFDEIDAGIGGATAQAVGARLALLANSRQVLVVTHLAQVAASADVQLVVTKSVTGGDARTAVHSVAGEERVAEVARMLSGSDSGAGLAHARELLGTGE